MSAVTQGAIYFDAGIGLDQWRRNIREIRNDLDGLNRHARNQTSGIDSAFKSLAVGIAGYFSINMFTNLIQQVIEVRGEFQKTEIALSTMLRSTVKASVLMAEMVELAKKTPFSFSEVSKGAKQLLAYQVPLGEVVDTLKRMGDIASGLGVPLARIQLVYGQVRAKGKLMGDDLRQFTEAGIPLVAELAKKFNKTTAEVSAMVTAGKVGFKDVKDVLFSLTDQGGLFFNLMEKQSASVSGKVSNLGDVFEQMLNKIGAQNEGLIYGSIEGLTYLVENYEEVIRVITTLIEVYGIYRTAIFVTSALQRASIGAETIRIWFQLARSIRNASDAQALFNLTTSANPYVLLITVIGALIAITYNYRQEIGELLGIIEEATMAQKIQEQVMQKYTDTFGKGVVETKSAIQQLIYVIRSEYSSLKQREDAYKKLIAIDETFVGVLDNQFRATNRLAGAFDNVVKRMQKMAMAQAEVAVRMEKFKQVAEAELNVGITQVQLEDATTKIKELTKQYKQGKISQDQYFKALKQTGGTDLNKKLIEQKVILKDISKEKDFIAQLDQKEISNLLKGNKILQAQIAGGKIQGKVITPDYKKELQKQFDNNEEILKLRFGVEPEIEVTPEAVLGWEEKIQAQIDELTIQRQKAPTKVLRFKIQAQIDALEEQLKPKKKKDANRQMSEILPEDSIKDLQRRIQLYSDALDVAVDNEVKLRKLDQFGQDKDKKGNPLLTGETVSVDEAVKRRQELAVKLAEAERKVRMISFQEQIEDAERQWNNYYALAEFYGKDIADAQYKDLLLGSQNYLTFLEKEKEFLQQKADTGILTQQQKNDLEFIQQKINDLTGVKTPLENFREDIDNTLAKMPSLVDQITYLQDLMNSEFQKKGNSADYLQKNLVTEERKKAIIQQQRDIYNEFIKEHETFENKKREIELRFDSMRKQIGANVGEKERLRILDEIGKAEGKEISALTVDNLAKTDLWIKAFGDLSKTGTKTMQNLRKALETELLTNSNLQASDIKVIQDQISKIDDTLASRNPFIAIGLSIDRYKKKREELNKVEAKFGKNSTEYNAKLQEVKASFGEIVEIAGQGASTLLGFGAELAGIFGTDELQQTLKDVQQLVDGIINTVAGYFSGNYGQMISGIVQIVGAMVKLLSGDNAREKNIRAWQRAIEDLKASYEALQFAIENTAGDSALTMQRGIVENLKEQQRILKQMKDEETAKKKADKDKVTQYESQIAQIDIQIQQVISNFQKTITGTDFRSLSEKIASALVDAYGQGTDAVKAFDKVVDEVFRNAVQNALRIKILEPVIKQMVDQLYSSMGFGNNTAGAETAGFNAQIEKYKEEIKKIEEQMAVYNGQGYSPQNTAILNDLNAQKQKLLDLIGGLQAQIASLGVEGNFDGLTPEERAKIKAMGQQAMQQYMNALAEYEDLFGSSAENATSMKGEIKGVTEKTAGVLEGQINAMRVNQVEILKLKKLTYQIDQKALILLGQIEINTRPILWIYEKLKKVIP